MRSLNVANLTEKTFEIEVKSRPEIPDENQAEAVERKLAIPNESRS
jgi:hypothetical protein